MKLSLSESEFERVVIELGSVLAVWLWHALPTEATALVKHFGEIVHLVVDLHFAEGHCLAVGEVVGVDDSFNLFLLFIYHVVCSREITLFKCVLGWAVAEEQVGGLSALVELHLLLVVFVLFLGQNHLLRLRLIIVGGG